MKLTEIISHADKVLSASLPKLNGNLKENEKRHGGYICIMAEGIPPNAPPLALVRLGEPNPEKAGKYADLAEEKARRLIKHRGHWSSYQSRNPEDNRFAGALRTNSFILSFSGLPELADEGFMLKVARDLEMITAPTAEKIRQLSGNGFSQVFPLTGS